MTIIFKDFQHFFRDFSEIFQRFFRDFQRFFRDFSEIFQRFFRDFSEIFQRFFRDFSEIFQRFFRDFSEMFFQFCFSYFQGHSFLPKVSGMVALLLCMFSMIFEHFPFIARECSEIVHRGRFIDFLENYKDCSNIFLRFFGDDSTKFA